MRKIAIIGCGGINSWFIKHINDMLNIFLDDKNEVIVQLFDEDIVEEKNLLRGNQNFEVENLMQPKAEVLAKRYKFLYENVYITEENIDKLSSFTDVVIGVDNHKTRKLIYEYCYNNGKYLLDMRAQGTQIAYYILDKDKPWEYYIKKYFSNTELMERKGSCQLSTDVENDHIENGNKIIAYMGAYGIFLKHLRGEQATTNEWQFVY